MRPPIAPRPMNPIAVLIVCAPSISSMSSAVSSRFGGGEDRVDLVGAAEADDRAVDGRVAQRPGDRDGARRGVVALGDRGEPLDELEVARELRFAEALVVLAPVVVGEALDPLAGHRRR